MYFNYIDNHKDRNILLIHSIPSSSLLFSKHIPILSEKYNIFLVDLPGFGNSSDIEVFKINNIVVELEFKLKEFNNLDVWGVSLGGIIALELSKTTKINNLIIESSPFSNNLIHTNEFDITNKMEKLLNKLKLEKIFTKLKNRSHLFRLFLILIYRIVNWGKINMSNDFMEQFIRDLNMKSFFSAMRYLQNFDVTENLKLPNRYIFVYDQSDPVIYFNEMEDYLKNCENKEIVKYNYKEHAPSVLYGDVISSDVLKLIK